MPKPNNSTAPLPFPILIGDIGGTNARFSILTDAYAEPKQFPNVRTADFATIDEAIQKGVLDAAPDLDVTRLKSGPLGGDQQIGALISTGEVDALIFFVDPLTPMPHDVDVKALMRLAIVYDIPMALNHATAIKLLPTLEA